MCVQFFFCYTGQQGKRVRSEQLAARCGVEPADCSRLLLTELLHYSALVSCCCSGGAPGGLATPTLAHQHPTYWIGAAFVPTIQPQISRRVEVFLFQGTPLSQALLPFNSISLEWAFLSLAKCAWWTFVSSSFFMVHFRPP